ncbi:MAG: hypothetical protein LUG13_02700 [Oscillospiraceae bacterium]|nr:hypothetical protein [Oscillospiraceae bacterium]
MLVIELEAQENGAHRNQSGGNVVPDGWAEIPAEMEAEATGYLPFIKLTVEGGVVTAVAQGEIPEGLEEAEEAEPTVTIESLQAENTLLKAQVAAQTERMEFVEEVITEIAMQVYS